MKSTATKSVAALLSSCLIAVSGCDWSSGGDSYNTSKGAGVNINFSGVYQGELSGSRAVEGQNISRFVLNQTGNRITVVDNNGSNYEGSSGSPGVVSNPSDSGAYPAGAELAQGQINFAGVNNATGRKITFAGIIHVVSVTDIQGVTTVDEEITTTETRTDNGSTTTITTVDTIVSPDGLSITERTTVTIIDNATGLPVTNPTTTTTVVQGTTDQSSSTEFSITEANSQYRLEGTWIEEGGGNHYVKARSPGTSGLITTTTTAADAGAAP